MNTINIAADATAQRIGIGNQYENEATAVVFDCSQFAEDHGAGTAQIIHRRPTELIGNVCTNVSQTGSTVTWLVTDDDTSFTGKGQVQLRWYVNDVLRESVIFPTYILPSVASSDDAPAEVKSALEQIMEWVNDNTISIEDLDERIANYFDEHPIPTPVTSVNEKLGDVVLTAEDVGAYSAEEADEKFCVPDGEYEELNAGTAKQLLSESYTLDQVPYLFRKSPDSDRAVEEIVGGTVGWNQLNSNTSDFSVSAEENKTYQSSVFSVVSGHKYLFMITQSATLTSATRNRFGVNVGSNNTYANSDSLAAGVKGWLYSASESNSARMLFWCHTPNTDVVFSKAMIFDLTTYFGNSTIADYVYNLETTTAGAGVAKLKEWGFFTEDYYEYSEPTLRSVEGLQSKKTVGFNQWDGTLQAGGINNDTGAEASASGYQRSDYIDVVGGSTYYCRRVNSTASVGRFHFYDAGKGYLGNIGNVRNDTFTVPANARYMRFAFYQLVLAENDICINLSDPTRNGQYEPYESHSYPLDSSVVLRGVPKLDSNNNLYYDGDVYPSDGQGKRRYGLVDLGTLNWTAYNADSSGHSFVVSIPSDAKTVTGKNTIINAICPTYRIDKFVNVVDWALLDKALCQVEGPQRFIIRDTAYSDATTFKTAMSGVMLLYELATPTAFTAQPYHNPQIVGDTEEWVTTGIVPVGHSTKYYQNLRKKIEGLPWNFATLIAPTEVTNKATRNYTTGSYLILNNVLYKVTTNIANGGTISPNSNVTATTIMAEFMSL